METKDKRKSMRVPLINEVVTLEAEANDEVVTELAQLHDISNGGVFIKTAHNLKPKNYIRLKFHLPGDLGLLAVTGKIVWKRWAVAKKNAVKDPIGVAVEFVEMSASTVKIIESYVTYLRNKQIITVSKRIIEEFFGPEPVI